MKSNVSPFTSNTNLSIPAAFAVTQRLAEECGEGPAQEAFAACPAAFNNAGLAFEATYTKLYPEVFASLGVTIPKPNPSPYHIPNPNPSPRPSPSPNPNPNPSQARQARARRA